MNLPAYPKYKKSGVGILGDVPEHWDVKRLKFLGKSIIGLTYNPSDICNEAEGTLVLRASNIQNGQIIFSDNVYVSSPIPSNLTTRPGDILVCSRNGSRRLVGKSGKITKAEAGHSFGAFTTVFRSSHSDFMFYYFNSGLVSQQAGLFQTSTIYQLTTGILNEMWTTIPDQVEQQKIAAFLDWKTGQIDALIARKKLLIEKLKEKRIALITHAVTKGLPAEASAQAGLDPNAKMKDSGIPWLGEVPVHWRQDRLFNVAELRTSNVNKKSEDNEQPIRLCNYVDVYYNEKITSDINFMQATASKNEVHRFSLRIDDVVITKDSETPDDIGIPTVIAENIKDLVCGYHLTILRPIKAIINGIYLFYAVASRYSAYQLYLAANGVTRFGLTYQGTKNLKIAFPETSEQQKITDFLDQETNRIDSLIEKNQQLIEKLTEYRTALITAATTGKIDVRGVEIKKELTNE